MQRADGTAKTYFISGCIFCAVGLFLLWICGALSANMTFLANRGDGNVRFLTLIFGITGGISTVVGAAILIWRFCVKRKRNRLLKHGECIQAHISGFPIDERFTMNGRPSFCIECNYTDPQTGIVHTFQSEKVFINPAFCVKAEAVQVYVDKQSDYKNYYVDIDSLLPKIMQH